MLLDVTFVFLALNIRAIERGQEGQFASGSGLIFEDFQHFDCRECVEMHFQKRN